MSVCIYLFLYGKLVSQYIIPEVKCFSEIFLSCGFETMLYRCVNFLSSGVIIALSETFGSYY